MNIFNKLSTLIRSNINEMIARAENPEKMLNQIIMDMREQLTKAKQEVAIAIAEERKLKAQAEEEGRQSQEWERRAMLAVQNEKDDLARQALIRQEEYAGRAHSLFETWQRHAEETERLKDSLRQLSLKIEEARRKKNLLIAKQKRAQAQKRIHETMAGLSDSSAFEAFDRMAQRIEDNERRALAAAEVSEDLSGDPLEREFARLESGGGSAGAEVRLLELKRKMGVLPPATPSETRKLTSGEAAEGAADKGSVASADDEKDDEGAINDAELLEAEFEELERGQQNRAGGA